MAVYIYGHKNPDSDSVCAAIALADLKSKIGVAAVPAAQGDLNPESNFILEKFGVSAPEIISSGAGKQVILVDHSDLAQSLDDLKKAEILGIVDHHKLGDVTTSNPLECWIWPVGCTCTVIKAMYDFFGVKIPKNIAGIMLCSILSDTVIFKSATCTDQDKEAANALAKIAGESNLPALGMQMFKVKSAVEGTPVRELVLRDYKDFDMSGKKVGIGQLEVVDLSILDSVKPALAKDIKALKAEGSRHSVFLLLTDIMKEGSEMLIASDDESVVKKAFGVAPEGGKVWLDGVMSRKKQVVPNFEKAFAK
ncbi:MAG: manganese-dependent inorganic pyrophosphatase [Proteobacteria bacterium]|nr:manganese-dependent inorganic pyrophosphatase [Pseudomonadota bacterium]MBU4128264.1 manganese-dependent inorganic pyrophosphatase [Pseudomonadota bacterium]MBU4389357.1 manganese-dependent inorganic pyrophosphatase [Pseudomonadota bacterium]MBU4420221.1 manganese-dependent inorganic pyrophosphatase [Pseudomonadota bacterium]MBU4504258.1 manganese-dependent inorganic pyrophosphatase [Pseudomonadota bacterium]